MNHGQKTLSDIGERGVIARLRRIAGPAPSGTLGIGDDAAVLPGKGPILLTTDVMVEGTHFEKEWFRPEEVGYKAVASNLSDAAAMGGRATHALVSLILPPRTTVLGVERLYRGMLRLAKKEGVALVGGNLARGRTLSVTVALAGSFPHGDPVRRTGAQPGDRLYVTGQPGLAYLGLRLLQRHARGKRKVSTRLRDLWQSSERAAPAWRAALVRSHPWAGRALKRFLTPVPRVQQARDLSFYRPTALIDTSDGLGSDLQHLAGSGKQIIIDAGKLPLPPGFRRLAETLGESPEEAALSGGEDYELLVAVPPDAAQRLGSSPVLAGVRLAAIGEVTEGKAGVFLCAEGRRTRLRGQGFRHF
jgi:thiamine-monophosphate kinase